jgi:plastocyanin
MTTTTMLARMGVALGLAVTALGTTPALAESYTVNMANMSFGRVPSKLKVGDTIVWTNHDSVPHTVTARDKSFDLRLNPGQSATQQLGKAGSFPFYCIYHSQMRGTLAVAG